MVDLSFITTQKRRLWQIKKTLLINLKDNLKNKNKIEFIIVDFDHPKDVITDEETLYDYIHTFKFKKYIDIKYLKYYKCDKLLNWHASKAKNIAHNYANGKILVNLDADNFTGANGGIHILKIYNKFKNINNVIFHQVGEKSNYGSYGRVCYSKELFNNVNGYNEKLNPYGGAEIDLLNRMIYYLIKLKNLKIYFFCYYNILVPRMKILRPVLPNINVKIIKNKKYKYNKCIRNSNETRIKLINTDKTIKEMIRENSLQTVEDILSNKFIAV